MDNQNNCTKYFENIAALVLGLLEPKEAEKLHEHLEKCENCKTLYQNMLNEEKDIRASFSEVAQKGEVIQNSLIEKLDKGNLETTEKPNVIKINRSKLIRNPLVKFAAAAVLIVALITVINYFGGSIPITTISFAEMTDAIKKEPWVYIKYSGISSSTTGPKDMWINFELKINAAKMGNGQLTFVNLNEHKSYTYDPNNKSITIDYIFENEYPEYFSSPISIVENINRQLEAQGAQTIIHQAEYNGETVLVQESTVSINNTVFSLSMYIQPDSKLLLCMQSNTTDSKGNSKIVGEITFEYPRSGPEDIYALNVPRNAMIISKLPSDEYMAIWDNYRRIRDEATQAYIMIVTHADSSSVIDMVDVDYKSDQNHRFERHFVFKAGQGYYTFQQQYKEQLGDTFDSLLAWIQNHYTDSGYISISFYNGKHDYSTSRDDKGNWSKIEKMYSDVSLLPNETLESICWPHIGKRGNVIEDDYSKQNNLICIERLQQGSIDQDTVSLPARFLFYIDSQKDYLCIRKVIEWRPDADWQEDKNWLDGIEPEKTRDGSITIEDITEVFQAPNGHWYPMVVEEKQTGIRKDYKDVPLKLISTEKIYLKTNPKFPDGIFNAENLPGQ
ncbi:MAG: zf-HC2 domain-containing protein [Sedimentisphaerales bacterium]|nr:zf-HC2 domain-containing protein [Sedimentisphaerales bacterium]